MRTTPGQVKGDVLLASIRFSAHPVPLKYLHPRYPGTSPILEPYISTVTSNSHVKLSPPAYTSSDHSFSCLLGVVYI